MHTRWDINKRSPGPDGGVQGSEFVVSGWNDGSEVLLKEFRVLAESCVGVQEENPLSLEVLPNLVVDNL